MEPPSWKFTAESIQAAADDLVTQQKEMNDAIAALSKDNATFYNTIHSSALLDSKLDFLTNQITFLSEVSPDEELRDASRKVEKQLAEFAIEQSQREDVYSVIKAVSENLPSDLSEEQNLLIKKEVEGFRRSGMDLDKETRSKVKELAVKLSDLGIEFSKNLAAEAGYIDFYADELQGVPSLDQYEQTPQGKYRMTFKYPDIDPVLKYAVSADTRRRAWLGYENRSEVNGPLLQQAVKLRDEKAKLMGYKSHADFNLEPKMAKNSENVTRFLNDLRGKLTAGGQKEFAGLMALKADDLKARHLTDDGNFYTWDNGFYNRLLLEKEYQIDPIKISEYFPLDQTITKMMAIFETLFGLKFERVETTPEQVWHEDVTLWAVYSTDGACLTTGPSSSVGKDTPKNLPGFVGYLYLDMHPRPNKYSHAANFNLARGYYDADGKRHAPVTALVCNFTKKTKDKPSLLKHSEVTTLFHELGHGIHNLVSHCQYARFHGTAVKRDFVEAPSQMLEAWTWDSESLKELSGHYTDSSKKMEDDLLESLIRTEHVNGALLYLRQLVFGIYDMALATDPNADITGLWNTLREDLCFATSDGNVTHGYGSFGHIMGGYDAGYYGYLWSKVFATDLFYSLFKSNPMNVDMGHKYMLEVLVPGGSREESESLEKALGRPPNNKAFLKDLGIEEAKL